MPKSNAKTNNAIMFISVNNFINKSRIISDISKEKVIQRLFVYRKSNKKS